uniref:Uncharacterized protein n=1 Tax=Arundo donax TaxID=35708 RepID=A0A0A9DU49_ARUDO
MKVMFIIGLVFPLETKNNVTGCYNLKISTETMLPFATNKRLFGFAERFAICHIFFSASY